MSLTTITLSLPSDTLRGLHAKMRKSGIRTSARNFGNLVEGWIREELPPSNPAVVDYNKRLAAAISAALSPVKATANNKRPKMLTAAAVLTSGAVQ
jgi:hypothetical protein